jgi:hypothetical protein
MSTRYVHDGQGRNVGYTKEMSEVIYAHGKNGQNVGYFNKKNNTTFDKDGRRYGVGDMTTSLIMEASKK